MRWIRARSANSAPCVIQRKVTNSYRAVWAAKAEADVRTTVDTARLKGANPFDIVLATLA